MIALGDIRVVRYNKRNQHHQVWHACVSCGKERWVFTVYGIPQNIRCKKCGGCGLHFRIHDNVPRDKVGKRLILRTCPSCGRKDWTSRANGKDEPRSPRCGSCASRIRITEHHEEMIHGGRMLVKLDVDSPYHPMVRKNGTVLRSRFVMAESLGRCLTEEEKVHHVSGNVGDDSITNLKLMTNSSHGKYHRKIELRETLRGGK